MPVLLYIHAIYLVEFAVAAIVVYALITQVIIPLWRDRPLFPILEPERKLTTKWKDARQDLHEAHIERDTILTNRETKKVKASTKKKGR